MFLALGLEKVGVWGQRSGFLGRNLQNVDGADFPSVRQAERAPNKGASGAEAPDPVPAASWAAARPGPQVRPHHGWAREVPADAVNMGARNAPAQLPALLPPLLGVRMRIQHLLHIFECHGVQHTSLPQRETKLTF